MKKKWMLAGLMTVLCLAPAWAEEEKGPWDFRTAMKEVIENQEKSSDLLKGDAVRDELKDLANVLSRTGREGLIDLENKQDEIIDEFQNLIDFLDEVKKQKEKKSDSEGAPGPSEQGEPSSEQAGGQGQNGNNPNLSNNGPGGDDFTEMLENNSEWAPTPRTDPMRLRGDIKVIEDTTEIMKENYPEGASKDEIDAYHKRIVKIFRDYDDERE